MDDDPNYDQRSLLGKVSRAAFSDITDSMVNTQSAVTVLAITLTLEICGLGMLYEVNDKVMATLNGPDKGVWVYISLAVYVVGFLNAFAIYSLIANKWPHQGAQLNTWLVSIIAGLLNVLLFFALTTSILR